MSNRMLRVSVNRSFNAYHRGDEFLVSETKEVTQLVKGNYFTVLAVEGDDKPEPDEKPASRTKAPKSTKSTKSPKSTSKAKS